MWPAYKIDVLMVDLITRFFHGLHIRSCTEKLSGNVALLSFSLPGSVKTHGCLHISGIAFMLAAIVSLNSFLHHKLP